MDRSGASLFRVFEQMKSRLQANPVLMQLPIGAEDEFEGVVDLVRMKAIYWDDATQGMKFQMGDIPVPLMRQARDWRERLTEAAAEADEDLMARYVDRGELSVDEIKKGLRSRTLASEIVPTLCGSAFRNKGVQAMLDAVVEYLPAPGDIGPVKGEDPSGMSVERAASDDEPVAALAFKIMNDAKLGPLTFLRVYSGVIKAGDAVYNPRVGAVGRIGRLLQMHANEHEEIDEVRAGDIAAAVGLRDVVTGETLCDPDKVITLEQIAFPDPVIHVALEAKTEVDSARMAEALGRLSIEDPSFRVHVDENSGQTIIAGMGELHLDVIVERLKREFGVDASVGEPQVACRETIRTASGVVEGRCGRQMDASSPYGQVSLRIEPNPGKGIEIVDVAGGVPNQFLLAIRSGIDKATQDGVLAGYPVMDVKVFVIGGTCGDTVMSEPVMRVAAEIAFREGLKTSEPVLLEPVMSVEVETPEEFMGKVLGELTARHGAIQGLDDRDGTKVISADVPMSEMFGYATTLRSLTQGRASYAMEFKHYAEAQGKIAEALITRESGKNDKK